MASGMASGMVLGTVLGKASGTVLDMGLARGDGGDGGDAGGGAACSSLPGRDQSPRFRHRHCAPLRGRYPRQDRHRHSRPTPSNSSIQSNLHIAPAFCKVASTSFLWMPSSRTISYIYQELQWSWSWLVRASVRASEKALGRASGRVSGLASGRALVWA